MITVMLSGSISKPPATRTSAKGNNYTVAIIRTGEGDDAVFASVTAFGDLAGTLAGLERGSPITVVGTGKIGTYEAKDGSGARANLSITVSRIMALVDHQSALRSKSAGQRQRSAGPQAPPLSAYSDPEPFRDKLPF